MSHIWCKKQKLRLGHPKSLSLPLSELEALPRRCVFFPHSNPRIELLGYASLNILESLRSPDSALLFSRVALGYLRIGALDAISSSRIVVQSQILGLEDSPKPIIARAPIGSAAAAIGPSPHHRELLALFYDYSFPDYNVGLAIGGNSTRLKELIGESGSVFFISRSAPGLSFPWNSFYSFSEGLKKRIQPVAWASDRGQLWRNKALAFTPMQWQKVYGAALPGAHFDLAQWLLDTHPNNAMYTRTVVVASVFPPVSELPDVNRTYDLFGLLVFMQRNGVPFPTFDLAQFVTRFGTKSVFVPHMTMECA